MRGWKLTASLSLVLLAVSLGLAGGDSLYATQLVRALLPRVQRYGALPAMAWELDALAAAEPPLSRRFVRRVSPHPRDRAGRLLAARPGAVPRRHRPGDVRWR